MRHIIHSTHLFDYPIFYSKVYPQWPPQTSSQDTQDTCKRARFYIILMLTVTRSSEAQQSTLEAFRTELLSSGLIPAGADKEAFVQRIGYDRFDDQTLLRFLRARKFDIPKAKIMWEANEKWRKEFGADDIAA